MKRNEINYDEAGIINAKIGKHFANANGDYAAIQREIEAEHGEGAIILTLRCFASGYYRNTAALERTEKNVK